MGSMPFLTIFFNPELHRFGDCAEVWFPLVYSTDSGRHNSHGRGIIFREISVPSVGVLVWWTEWGPFRRSCWSPNLQTLEGGLCGHSSSQSHHMSPRGWPSSSVTGALVQKGNLDQRQAHTEGSRCEDTGRDSHMNGGMSLQVTRLRGERKLGGSWKP